MIDYSPRKLLGRRLFQIQIDYAQKSSVMLKLFLNRFTRCCAFVSKAFNQGLFTISTPAFLLKFLGRPFIEVVTKMKYRRVDQFQKTKRNTENRLSNQNILRVQELAAKIILVHKKMFSELHFILIFSF